MLVATGLKNNPAKGTKAWLEALIDGGLVFGFTFVSALAVFGFPPSLEAMYMAFISSLIAFFASLAAYRKVKTPPAAISPEHKAALDSEIDEVMRIE